MPSDWRTGGRFERFEYRLTDLSGTPLGTLDGVESCSLSGSVYSDVRWGGSLVWSGITQPDWAHLLIQPWYIVEGVGYADTWWPDDIWSDIWGVSAPGEWPLCPPCYASAPLTDYTDTVPQSVTVQLYDTSYALAKRLRTSAPVTLPAGTVLTTALASRLSAAGVRASIEASAKTNAAPLNWDTGTSEMVIANDILGSLGYWSVHAAADGSMLGIPWVDPGSRVAVYDFDTALIVDPAWSLARDDWSVANRLTGVPRVVSGVVPTPVTVTLDAVQPSSPYTYANRGFWVDAPTLRDVNAADSAALTSMLTQDLINAASVTSTVTVAHAWVPEVELASVVTFEAGRYSVQKMNIDTSLGLRVKGEWRAV